MVGWLILLPQRYESLSQSVIATLSFSSNIWFWLEAGDYFGSNVEFEPLLHTWSLAVEEQFYLFFPLLLLSIASCKRGIWITIVACLVVLSFSLSIWLTQNAPTANFYLLPSRIWELGAGALLALGAIPLSRHRLVNETAGWLGIILIVVSIILITSQTPFPGLAALPSVLGSMLIIYSGTSRTTIVGRFLSLRPLTAIGLVSYSLYLWHWPILVAARSFNHNAELTNITAVVCVLLSIILAWLSWQYIEKPFRKPASQSAVTGTHIAILSTAGIISIGLLSAFIVHKEGLVGQWPEDRLTAYREAIQRDPLDRQCMRRTVDNVCTIGSRSVEPSIAIWGDSHAGALVPGLDAWLSTIGKGGLAFTKSACPPILGVYRADLAPKHGCDTNNASVLKTILDNKQIDTVLLFGRWALATEGTRADNEHGRPALLAQSNKQPVGISDNHRLVEQGLDQLLAALSTQNIKVVIISGTPEIGYVVPDLVLLHGDQVPIKFRPTRQSINQRNKRADQILTSVAKRYDALVASPKTSCVNKGAFYSIKARHYIVTMII